MTRYVRSIREVAMDYLSRREHTRHELLQKLLVKDFDFDEVDAALSRLVEQGLLSDERFTEAYVRQRSLRGIGPLKIRAELRQKGVAEQVIDSWLNDQESYWSEQARAVRERKYGHAPIEEIKEKARQMRFLHSRGFSTEQIRHALGDDDW